MSAMERGPLPAREVEIPVRGARDVDIREPWRVDWSAVWAGALASLATALVFGLIGVALGVHKLGPAGQIAKWGQVNFGTLFWTVLGAFLAFAVGGWVAGKIAGTRWSEPAMLHGALSWLVALPLLIVLLGQGAGSAFGGWYGGLIGAPAWAVLPSAAPPSPEAATIAQNEARAAVAAVLLGLMGAVIGGWLASGEPMTFTYYRQRPRTVPRRNPM